MENIMDRTICFDDVKRATIALAMKDRALALGLLAQFGVSRASNLTLSQWREYCFDAQAILDHGEQPKPAQTLGDLLRKAGDRLPSRTPTIFELRDKWNREHGVTFSKTPTLDKLESECAGNARMIARDGAAKFKPVILGIDYAAGCAPAPVSTAKPALSFLTYSPDLQPSSHQVGPKFGSALLRG